MQAGQRPSTPSTPKSEGFPFDSPISSPLQSPPSLRHQQSSSFHLFGPNHADAIERHQEDQLSYATKRDILAGSIDVANELVKGIEAFNEDKWEIRLPNAHQQLGLSSSTPISRSLSASTGASSLPSSLSKATGSNPSTPSLRRSATEFSTSSSSSSEEAEPVTTPTRPTPVRSFTTADPSVPSTPSIPSHPLLSVLSVDLQLGTHSSTTSADLLPALSLQTVSHLFARRLTATLSNLSALKTRVLDTSSRVLITGDLNGGKSTFTNALLRREVLPVDQQPCTTVFCEVLDAKSYNEGKEEVHAIRDLEKYDVGKEETFERFSLEDVEKVQLMVEDEREAAERGEGSNNNPYQLLKAYVTDCRSPIPSSSTSTSSEETIANPSFIRNGLVSISLIDAPGLNRDTLSTTAIFARQSEIDVIVFVVSAENHFTLSAKEFLWNASREKAYVFVVVNKWEGIRDKKRCERVVGEQLKQLSPGTWEQKDELVHFVDAGKVLIGGDKEGEEEEEDDSWIHLEQSLRSFVLLKRARSKLAPAKTYLLNLVSDLLLLANSNILVATNQRDEAANALAIIKPKHEKLEAAKEIVESEVDLVEESMVKRVEEKSWKRLEDALMSIRRGELPSKMTTELSLPSYPGFLNLWTWAAELKSIMVKSVELEIRKSEDEARSLTSDGVNTIMKDLAAQFLPSDNSSSTNSTSQTPERVFRPEVMYLKRRRGVGKLAMRGISTGLGLGVAGVGIGIGEPTWKATDFEISILDLVNLDRVYKLANWGSSSSKDKDGEENDALETGAIVSLGIGSVGMIGSRLVGVKGALDSVVRAWEILNSKQARDWAAPVVAVLTVGLGVYLVYDLPYALPRNIGRKLDLALSPSPTTSSSLAPPQTFSSAHATRISRETRKVLRLAGWDLRERYRAALEECANERKEVEGKMGRAEEALDWLEGFVEKAEVEEKKVKEVAL